MHYLYKKDLLETDIEKVETLANQFISVFTKESNTELDLLDPTMSINSISVVFSESIMLKETSKSYYKQIPWFK